MTFTHQELMDILKEIVENYLHGHIDSAFEISRRELDLMQDSDMWRLRNGISLLIKNGYLSRVTPGTQDIPFTCQLTELGIETVNAFTV